MTPTIIPSDQPLAIVHGSHIAVPDHVPHVVEAIAGTVWITQASAPRDIVLEAGQRIVLSDPDRALIGSLGGDAAARVGRAGRPQLARAA